MAARTPDDAELASWSAGRLLSATARRVERAWDARLGTWGLNHASLPVLVLLASGPKSQRELATATGVSEQTMSRTLGTLERAGYVMRGQHSTDRRRHRIELTGAGRETLAVAGAREPAEDLVVRGLAPDEVEVLRELLARVLRTVEEAPEAQPDAEARPDAEAQPDADPQSGAARPPGASAT